MPSRRILALAGMDSLESMKPPSYDAMILVISVLGAALAALQPLTDPVAIVQGILDPAVFFAVNLYLALRASAGIAELVESSVMQVYLSYPMSRLSVAVSLFLSRILVPSVSLLGAPLLVALVLLPRVISSNPLGFLAAYAAHIVMAVMFGLAYALIALKSRVMSTASVLSITFYFAYMGSSLVLRIIATSIGKPILVDLSDAMLFHMTASTYLQGVPVKLWQLALVPALTSILLAVYFVYMRSRFEPA